MKNPYKIRPGQSNLESMIKFSTLPGYAVAETYQWSREPSHPLHQKSILSPLAQVAGLEVAKMTIYVLSLLNIYGAVKDLF